jgi:hypothetical protein
LERPESPSAPGNGALILSKTQRVVVFRTFLMIGPRMAHAS